MPVADLHFYVTFFEPVGFRKSNFETLSKLCISFEVLLAIGTAFFNLQRRIYYPNHVGGWKCQVGFLASAFQRDELFAPVVLVHVHPREFII